MRQPVRIRRPSCGEERATTVMGSAHAPHGMRTIPPCGDADASAPDVEWLDVHCGACGKPMMVTFASLRTQRTVDCPDCLAARGRPTTNKSRW